MDEEPWRAWDFSRYEELIGGLREEERTIGAMLSAAILDVSREVEEVETRRRKAEDELEGMFREWEIRGAEEKEDKRLLSHSSNFFSEKPKTAGEPDYRVEDENSAPRSAGIRNFLSGESAAALEEEMVRNFLVPGAGRTFMPPVPEKSKRLRDAERPDIYPFCSLPIEDVERGLKLQAMEEMMQSREPELVWDFLEMSFEERLRKDTLIERISGLLLLEPDLIQKYFSRDDSLLLAIYFKTPRSRVVRKQWTSVYRVMPDFQNWIEHFTPDFIPPVPLYDVDD